MPPRALEGLYNLEHMFPDTGQWLHPNLLTELMNGFEHTFHILSNQGTLQLLRSGISRPAAIGMFTTYRLGIAKKCGSSIWYKLTRKKMEGIRKG